MKEAFCTPRRRKVCIIFVLLLMIGAIVAVILGVALKGNLSGSNKEDTPSNSQTDPTLAPSLPQPTMSPGAASPTLTLTLTPTMYPTPAPTQALPVMDVILPFALFDGEEFESTETYQSQAYQWLNESETRSDPWQLVQRYALASLHFSTYAVPNDIIVGGDGWFESDWLTEGSECDWQGIVCNDEQQVTELNLEDLNLSGTLAPELVLLSSLEIIDVTDNPTAYNENNFVFLGQMTSLKRLLLRGTLFQYDKGVPDEIGFLTQLEILDLSNVWISGELRGQVFEQLQNLEVLHLSGNEFGSPIPVEIAQLPNLKQFSIEDAAITGDLSFMQDFQAIETINLSGNNLLGGSISATMENLVTLRYWYMKNCDVQGSIPMSIGTLTDLQQFSIPGNRLTGSLPDELGQLSVLEQLHLQDNEFGGSVPQTVCNNVWSDVLLELEADCLSEITCDCCSTCF